MRQNCPPGQPPGFPLPFWSAHRPHPAKTDGGSVNIGWNCLLIEHLNRIGEKKLAFDLLSRLIMGFSGMLKREHALMESFTSDSGSCWGKRNGIRGLLPPLLLLEVAGIQIVMSRKTASQARTPAPGP